MSDSMDNRVRQIKKDVYNGYNTCEFNYRQLQIIKRAYEFELDLEFIKRIADPKRSPEEMEIGFFLGCLECFLEREYSDSENRKYYLSLFDMMVKSGAGKAYMYLPRTYYLAYTEFSPFACLDLDNVKLPDKDRLASKNYDIEVCVDADTNEIVTRVNNYVVSRDRYDSLKDLAEDVVFADFDVLVAQEETIKTYSLIGLWTGKLDEGDVKLLGVNLDYSELTPPVDKEVFKGASEKVR